MNPTMFFISGGRADQGIVTTVGEAFESYFRHLVSTELVLLPDHGMIELGNTGSWNTTLAVNKDFISQEKTPTGIVQASYDLSKKFKSGDGVFFVGDRFEILIAATLARRSPVKIFHLHGGELSFGSIDNYYRNSISALSDVHFAATKKSAARLRRMLPDKHVYFTGSPVLADDPTLKTVRGGESRGNKAIVTYHPNSMNPSASLNELDVILEAIKRVSGYEFIITAPNQDPGFSDILSRITTFANVTLGVRYIPSLGHRDYLNLLKQVKVVAGNSSSGLIEAPHYGCFTLNIGHRQDGRERCASIYDVEFDVDSIVNVLDSLKTKVFPKSTKSRYYKKDSAREIAFAIYNHLCSDLYLGNGSLSESSR